ncbi:MAG: GTP-binding protein [Clostridia bacterium]|nr:GTP-binding protein [Clostridia bacterium]
MTKQIKVDIFSGFLGAGKTTLIKKLIKEIYAGEKVVLIENEFGEIGIDGGFLADAGITVNEMNSGCICCSLVGDFGKALSEVIETYTPDRIIIEPSGVGKLSDIIRAVEGLHDERLLLNGTVAVVDAKKCKMYMKNFGEFFNDQIESAGAIIFSHVNGLSEAKLAVSIALVREHNPDAVLVSTDWDLLSGEDILAAMEKRSTLTEELAALEEHHRHHGHHHHHEDGEECGCGHHHHHEDGEECGCGHQHHHEDGEECGCGHHHHHEDGEECGYGHHHHHEDGEECGCGHHHHHHHADEVFTSCGFETAHPFTEDGLREILEALEDEHAYGMVLRAKGIVASADGGEWIHFDYVPGEPDIRRGKAGIIGRLCVIGSKIDETKLKTLFGI